MATVHAVVSDGQVVDPALREALTALVAELVESDQERPAA